MEKLPTVSPEVHLQDVVDLLVAYERLLNGPLDVGEDRSDRYVVAGRYYQQNVIAQNFEPSMLIRAHQLVFGPLQ